MSSYEANTYQIWTTWSLSLTHASIFAITLGCLNKRKVYLWFVFSDVNNTERKPLKQETETATECHMRFKEYM